MDTEFTTTISVQKLNRLNRLLKKKTSTIKSLTDSLDESQRNYDKLYFSFKELQGELSRLRYDNARMIADKTEMIEKERGSIIYKIKTLFWRVFDIKQYLNIK
jgi:hypothetical protein